MADQKKRMMDGELYARKGLLYGFELGSTEILAGAGAQGAPKSPDYRVTPEQSRFKRRFPTFLFTIGSNCYTCVL